MSCSANQCARIALELGQELGRVAAQQRERRLRRLAHDVAELAGDRQLAVAGHRRRLDEQDLAADRGPGEPGRDAGAAGPAPRLREVRAGGRAARGRASPRPSVRPVEPPSAIRRASLRQTVPIWRSRLRTPASRVYSSMIARSAASVNAAWRRLQPVLADLPRDQVAAGDVELLVDRVAGELDHLHPVAQRRRDRVEHVRGGDEDDLGEVEVEVEVVVAEGVVLGRVEDLEHRAGRIAAEVGAHLVDLVDHEDGVAGAGVAERADDRARHRADVGAAVAADLRLVADAADRDPLEAAPERAGDRAPEAGLADAGRADEAEDRAARLGPQLADRQVLEDPVLDLLEVVVVGVEDLAGVLDVEVVVGALVPRQVEQPVEVGPDHAVLGGGRRQPLEPRRARGRPPCGPARAAPAASTRSRSSLISACCSSPSPSSAWIARSCSRR